MAQPKLIVALNVLTKEEWASFRKFLLMYTSKESDNYVCFQKFFDSKSKLEEEGIDEKIRVKYFSQMSPKVFSNMLSRLFGWFENWLAIETFKNKKYAKELHLIKGYNEKSLFKLADSNANKLIAKIQKSSHIDIVKQQTLSQLYQEQYFSNNPIKRKKNNTVFKDSVNHYIKAINEQSLIYLLELQNVAYFRSFELSKEKEFLENQISISDNTELIDILKLTLKMLNEHDLESFMELRERYETGIINPSSKLNISILTYLHLVSIQLWHNSELEDVKLITDLIQLKLKSIEEDDLLKLHPVNLFNAINQVGAYLSYEETQEVINKWVDKVQTQFPQSTFEYCQAINAFRHDRYEDLPKILRGLEFDDIDYKIISNAQLILAYYKLGEEDIVVTLIDNFRKQLKRNRKSISKVVFKRLTNMINAIVVLRKSKYDKSINFDLADFQPIFFRSWFLKELESGAKR